MEGGEARWKPSQAGKKSWGLVIRPVEPGYPDTQIPGYSDTRGLIIWKLNDGDLSESQLESGREGA